MIGASRVRYSTFLIPRSQFGVRLADEVGLHTSLYAFPTTCYNSIV
jgi:hypothetical protein